MRFDVSSDDADVMTLGFEKDGKTVLIIINPAESEKEFLTGFNCTTAVTDKNNNLTESNIPSGSSIKITPQSVTTVIF